MPIASIIENAGMVLAGVFLVVFGALRGDGAMIGVGLGLLGVKAGTFAALGGK